MLMMPISHDFVTLGKNKPYRTQIFLQLANAMIRQTMLRNNITIDSNLKHQIPLEGGQPPGGQ
jgi:hypothetical protein